MNTTYVKGALGSGGDAVGDIGGAGFVFALLVFALAGSRALSTSNATHTKVNLIGQALTYGAGGLIWVTVVGCTGRCRGLGGCLGRGLGGSRI